MLRELGFESEIFAGLRHRDRAQEVLPAEELPDRVRKEDAVIYHLSLGSPLAREFAEYDCKQIVLYHNITPVDFYRDVNPIVAFWIDRGREDLAVLAGQADLCVAPSEFNARDLRSAGAANVHVIPLPIDLQRLHPAEATPATPPLLLFVGRVAPNKRIEELLRMLAALRALVPDVRLAIIGSANDNASYFENLKEFARELHVQDAVEMTGNPVDEATLRNHYMQAAAYVSASDHEGFCVPLVEAMAFGVPVVAYAGGAVPETLGSGGITLATRDPLVWAETLHRLLTGDSLREQLIAAGHARCTELGDRQALPLWERALAEIGLSAAPAPHPAKSNG